jgi:cell division protein FtsX
VDHIIIIIKQQSLTHFIILIIEYTQYILILITIVFFGLFVVRRGRYRMVVGFTTTYAIGA